MKVWIGKYISPWTTQDAEHWWFKFRYDKWDWEVEEEDRDWLDRLVMTILDGWNHTVNRLVNATWGKRNRIIKVKIDYWDNWSADQTLAVIILPLLKQLQERKHGAPFTDDEDVPEELRSTSAPPKENEWDTDDNWFKRWDWIMDEMIFAFEQLTTEYEKQFWSGETDIRFEPCPDNEKYSQMVTGPNHTFEVDTDGLKAHEERISRGLRLFGKYYRGLWD